MTPADGSEGPDPDAGPAPDLESDPDYETALREARDSLREAHPDATLGDETASPAWLTALLEPDTPNYLRRDGARVLAMLAERFPDELVQVTPAVAAHLDDPVTRRRCLQTLGHLTSADPDAVRDETDTFVSLLEVDDPRVVREATWVLSNLTAADPDMAEAAVPALVPLLDHDDEEVRRRAAGALEPVPAAALSGELGALESLLTMLESPSLYRTAGRALVANAPAFGDAVAEGLFAHLDSGRSARREHAVWTLVRLADEYPDLVRPQWPTLLDLLRDDDDHQVLNGVAATLAAVATDAPTPDLLAELAGVLNHEDSFVARYACLALGDVAVATGDERAVSALADARDDAPPLVARRAEQLLVDAAAEYPATVAGVALDFADESPEE